MVRITETSQSELSKQSGMESGMNQPAQTEHAHKALNILTH